MVQTSPIQVIARRREYLAALRAPISAPASVPSGPVTKIPSSGARLDDGAKYAGPNHPAAKETTPTQNSPYENSNERSRFLIATHLNLTPFSGADGPSWRGLSGHSCEGAGARFTGAICEFAHWLKVTMAVTINWGLILPRQIDSP
jgi:hypothetical protein